MSYNYFIKCPKCGRFLICYGVTTRGCLYRCLGCGYDSAYDFTTTTVTSSTDTFISGLPLEDNKTHMLD